MIPSIPTCAYRSLYITDAMDDIVAPPTATQDAIPALADDLLKDRIRQFLEFLDDEVSSRLVEGDAMMISADESACGVVSEA